MASAFLPLSSVVLRLPCFINVIARVLVTSVQHFRPSSQKNEENVIDERYHELASSVKQKLKPQAAQKLKGELEQKVTRRKQKDILKMKQQEDDATKQKLL